jgi:nicotinamide-nucleotide amidase
MEKKNKVYLLSIGDELLIGQVINTNVAWLSSKLNEIGLKAEEHRTIADRADSINSTLSELMKPGHVVICTGGLGPTGDDITKNTLRQFFQDEWRTDEDVLAVLDGFMKARGRTLDAINKGQAELPRSCKTWLNHIGTAPGMLFDTPKGTLISLPGVPREMSYLMENYGLEFLKSRFQLAPIRHRTFHTEGIPESQLMVYLRDWELQLPKDLSLAYLPKAGRVRLRISQLNPSQSNLVGFEAESNRLRNLLGIECIGMDETDLPQAVLRHLMEKKATLATAESCTGGQIAGLLTAVPGASAAFMGGVVAYDNSVKIRTLGVNPEDIQNQGAVSSVVVEAMAKGIRHLTGADYGISTSGIAGPGGGSPEKPVGLVWIGISGPAGTYSRAFKMASDRAGNIERSAFAALNLFRKTVLNDWTLPEPTFWAFSH